MSDPIQLLYCKVSGTFKAFTADGSDSNDLPDFTAMTGTGVIVPSAKKATLSTEGRMETFFPTDIKVTIDADGKLSQGGRPYVMLLCPGEGINPPEFNYKITLTLQTSPTGPKIPYGPFAFDVTPGGEVDLSAALPVAVNAGVPITRGEKGDKGDTGATGPQGPIGPQGIQGLSITGPKGDKGDTGADSTVAGPQGPQGEQGIAGPVGPIGPAGITWKGEWLPGIDYFPDDAVFHNNASWFATGDPTLGEEPSDEAVHWWPLALQGNTGPQGPAGAQGVAGPVGPAGIQGEPGPILEGNMRYLGEWETPPGAVFTFEDGVPAGWTVPAGTTVVDRINPTLGTTKALKIPYEPDGNGYTHVTIGPLLGAGKFTTDFWITPLEDLPVGASYDLNENLDLSWQAYVSEGGQQTITKTFTTEQGILSLQFGWWDTGETPVEFFLERVAIPDPSVPYAVPYPAGSVVTFGGKDYLAHTPPGTSAPGDYSSPWDQINEPVAEAMLYRGTPSDWLYSARSYGTTWNPSTGVIPPWITLVGAVTPTLLDSPADPFNNYTKALRLDPGADGASNGGGIQFTVEAPSKIRVRHQVDSGDFNYFSIFVDGLPLNNNVQEIFFNKSANWANIGAVIPGTGTKTIEIRLNKYPQAGTGSGLAWLGEVNVLNPRQYGYLLFYRNNDVIKDHTGAYYALEGADDGRMPGDSPVWKPLAKTAIDPYELYPPNSFTVHGSPSINNRAPFNVEFATAGNTNNMPGIEIWNGAGSGGNPSGMYVNLNSTGYLYRGRNGGVVKYNMDANGHITTLGGQGSYITASPTNPDGTTAGNTNYGLAIGPAGSTTGPGRVWAKTWGSGANTGWAPIASSLGYSTKTANYTLAVADELVIFNGTSLTATLPDPTTNTSKGRVYVVKNIHSTALTVVSAGASKTIDGAASISLAQWEGRTVASDGTQWLVLEKSASSGGSTSPSIAHSLVFGG